MAILSKVGIVSGSLIEAGQITQIIDALTASGSVIDISITGSLNVAGTTRLGKLGTSTKSPLIFNPDTSGESVFYVKNPSGTLTIGTGENPYLGGDLMTLSPLGALGLSGNLTVSNNTIVNGNLGVGTTIPQAKFVVSNNNSQSIYMDYSVGLNANYIESFNTATQTPLDMIYYMATGATGSHRFYTNGNQRMVINRDGAVGINNATPVGALDVIGTTIMRGGDLIISSSYPRLYLTDTDSNSDYSIINDNGALNIYDDTNEASRIFISSGGNVGIGGVSTGAKLDVNGNITVSGNVGIGTTNPLYKLSSHATSSGRVIVGNFSNDTNEGSTEVGIRLAHNNSDLCSVNLISQRVGPDAGADFSIELANSAGTPTERFRITENGIAVIGNITVGNTLTTNFSSSGTVTIGTPGVSSTSHIQLWPQDASGNAYYINDSASIFNIGNGVFSGGSGTNMISVGGSFGVAIRKTFTNGSAALDVNGNTIITGSLISRPTAESSRSAPHIRLDYTGSSGLAIDKSIGIIASYVPEYSQPASYIKFVSQGSWSGGSYPSGIEFYTSQQLGGTEKLTLSLNQNGVIEFNNYTSNGTVTTTGANGTISVSSDKNLKKADGFVENGIEKVMALKPRYFYWKPSTGFGNTRQLGFYAQEVNSVSEEAANTPATGQQWGIYDRGLIAILTKAVQEQQAQIEILQQQVNTLISGSL